MKLTIDGFRSIIRPALTLSGWGLMIYLAVGNPEVRQQIITGTMMMVSFWFGARANNTTK